MTSTPPRPAGDSQTSPFTWRRWFIPAAVLAIGLDQLSKWWLFSLHGSVLPSYVVLAENRGVAWSIGDGRPALVTAMTAVLIPVLSAMWWFGFRRQGAGQNLAWGLILGGAVGNAIDRICAHFGWLGLKGVRDFINVDLGFWPCNPWPTFNLADSAISIGFLLLVFLSFIKPPSPAVARAPAVTER